MEGEEKKRGREREREGEGEGGRVKILNNTSISQRRNKA